jgi:GNAT superfamily N-acetyltransferase
MDVALRAATNSDSGRIADILLQSRSAFVPYAASPHTDDEVRMWVCDILLTRDDVTVALVARQLVGVMFMHRAEDVSWISQLYVHPSHVGQGIGSCLLARALETAARPIRVFTFQQNAGARRFYERNVFVPIRFTDGSGNEERCPDVLYERVE